MRINKIVIDKHGTGKETTQKAHGGLTTMNGEIVIHMKV